MLNMPKRWLNRSLVQLGLFGIVFQCTAAVFSWWHDYALPEGWIILLMAPALCVASGMVTCLQLQKEPN